MRQFVSVFAERLFICSAVMKCMCLEMVMKKPILLMNMLLMHRVMLRYLFFISSGSPIVCCRMCFVFFRVVFPCSAPISFPNMSCAAMASSLEINLGDVFVFSCDV